MLYIRKELQATIKGKNKKKKSKMFCHSCLLIVILKVLHWDCYRAEFERVEVDYNTVSSSIVEGVMGYPACDMGGQKLFCDQGTVFIVS